MRTRAETLCYFFYITVTYTNDHLLIIMYTFTRQASRSLYYTSLKQLLLNPLIVNVLNYIRH